MLSRYENLAEIYSDTRCKVYKATRREQDPIIVKRYELDSWMDRELYTREAEIHSSLQHPNICRCFDYYTWEENSHFYLAIEMELMDRDLEIESLRRINQKDSWSEAEIQQCLSQLVSAFAYAQTRKIAHRDIKPANLFVHHGQYKVADFGSASFRPKDSTKEKLNQTVAGSPAFFSPELVILHNQAVRSEFENPRVKYNAYKSDVYTLAVSLMAISSPVSMTNLQSTDAVMRELNSRPFSQNLKELFERMLVIDPEARVSFTELNRILNGGEASRDESGVSSEDSSDTVAAGLEEGIAQPFISDPEVPVSLKTQNRLLKGGEASKVISEDSPDTYNSFTDGLEAARVSAIAQPLQYRWQGPTDSKTSTFRFHCLVCNGLTSKRYFPCLKHSICSPKCVRCAKLVLSSTYNHCPVCAGMNYLEELRKSTELKLRLASCHFCNTHMEIKACVYCVCGGAIQLVCSKECVRRKMISKQFHCTKCDCDIEVHRLMEARLFKSWLDLPVYSELTDCCMCFNAIKTRFPCEKRHGLCDTCQSRNEMYLCPVCTQQQSPTVGSLESSFLK